MSGGKVMLFADYKFRVKQSFESSKPFQEMNVEINSTYSTFTWIPSNACRKSFKTQNYAYPLLRFVQIGGEGGKGSGKGKGRNDSFVEDYNFRPIQCVPKTLPSIVIWLPPDAFHTIRWIPKNSMMAFVSFAIWFI